MASDDAVYKRHKRSLPPEISDDAVDKRQKSISLKRSLSPEISDDVVDKRQKSISLKRLLPPEIKENILSMLKGDTSHMTMNEYATYQYSQGVFNTIDSVRSVGNLKHELLGAARGGYVDVFTSLMTLLSKFPKRAPKHFFVELFKAAEVGLFVDKNDTIEIIKIIVRILKTPLRRINYGSIPHRAVRDNRVDVIRNILDLVDEKTIHEMLYESLKANSEDVARYLLDRFPRLDMTVSYEGPHFSFRSPGGTLVNGAVWGGNVDLLKEILVRAVGFGGSADSKEDVERDDDLIGRDMDVGNVHEFIRDGRGEKLTRMRNAFVSMMIGSYYGNIKTPAMFLYVFDNILDQGRHIHGLVASDREMSLMINRFVEKGGFAPGDARSPETGVHLALDRWFNFLVQSHGLDPNMMNWMNVEQYNRVLAFSLRMKDDLATYQWFYSRWDNHTLDPWATTPHFAIHLFNQAAFGGMVESVRAVLREYDRIHQVIDEEMISDTIDEAIRYKHLDLLRYVLNMSDGVLPKPYLFDIDDDETYTYNDGDWETFKHKVDQIYRPLFEYIRWSFGENIEGYHMHMYELYGKYVRTHRWSIARFIQTLVPITDEVWNRVLRSVPPGDYRSALFLAFEYDEDRLRRAIEYYSRGDSRFKDHLDQIQSKLDYIQLFQNVNYGGLFRSLGKRVDSLESRILTTLGTLALAVFAIR